MTFINRWCAGWLAHAGYRIAEPGTPDPAEPAVAAKMLCAAGWTLFAPGIEPPVPPVTLEHAKQVCEAHDHRVFPPRDPPALGAWVPHKHEKGKPLHPTRTVTAALGNEVHYMSDGAPHTCKVQSFWGWRADRDARHQAVDMMPVDP